ncbi:MBL fold metallo-hydrolase [Fictibacillus phosphorivorans]|uniref:MBL fold metallo-hydrolase n=1 Tax=Fictibacillus phosphorivorans TaxID=1221500 RepID=A0A163SJ80_9BACL|nr:MBL fold metallo-hydrolase [Fictibacillus phosphorivorans]KZE69218.1 MBL fold metallo-hydrolase [Fictibacillus phosphorivorans]
MTHIQNEPPDMGFLPMTSVANGIGEQIAPDVYGLTTQIVNVYFIRCQENPSQYVLVDAGMPKSEDTILKWAEKWFDGPPTSMILTHGHFDHIGAAVTLAEEWNIPVYAHPLEIPYLNGDRNYPKPDPTVNGGLVTELSPLFPNHGINLSEHIKELPSDGSVPGLQGWRWIHTPGHTEGHVSFFRDSDKVLLAGDAFVTVKQESLFKVLTQKQEISGPPKYFTTDWTAAKESVIKLASLEPEVAATGHGIPMNGEQLHQELNKLVTEFDQIAKPKHGKYLN